MLNFAHFFDSIFLFLILVVITIVTFFINGKHLLSLLLTLESLIIRLFCLAVLTISSIGIEYYYSLVILTFAACEAAVGLSVLVNIISSHGSRYVNSINLIQC